MMEWINVKDRLPEQGQHVLVCDSRDNVFPFPSGCSGDDGHGRVRMGDAIYVKAAGAKGRDCWQGQGPCNFNQVTHWMPLPALPDGA